MNLHLRSAAPTKSVSRKIQTDPLPDIFNGGPLDNQAHMPECANYSGQIWKLTGKVTPLRHLRTFTMTTAFRGEQMCLTMDGTLTDNIVRLTPCSDGCDRRLTTPAGPFQYFIEERPICA